MFYISSQLVPSIKQSSGYEMSFRIGETNSNMIFVYWFCACFSHALDSGFICEILVFWTELRPVSSKYGSILAALVTSMLWTHCKPHPLEPLRDPGRYHLLVIKAWAIPEGVSTAFHLTGWCHSFILAQAWKKGLFFSATELQKLPRMPFVVVTG